MRRCSCAGGAAEVVIGVGALVLGGPVFAALVALSYLGSPVFVALALRSGSPISSCGCFGKVDTPPSLVHLVVDLLAAGCAITVAVAGDTVALPDVLADQPAAGVPFVILAVTGIYLVFLSFTSLPKTLAAAHVVPGGPRVSVAGQEPQRPSRGIAITNWLVEPGAGRACSSGDQPARVHHGLGDGGLRGRGGRRRLRAPSRERVRGRRPRRVPRRLLQRRLHRVLLRDQRRHQHRAR